MLIALAFAALAADPQWHQLRSSEAGASSFLRSNWNKYIENYHPNYALDDNPATAWVEGVEGDGVGSVIVLPVSTLSSARAVKVSIRNGYQKSDTLLTANAAPKDVVVRIRAADGTVSAEQQATLDRKTGWQEIVVPLAGKPVGQIELEIVSVTAGRTYQDTCISDIDVYVDSDVPYNADAEAARQATLKKWIAERVATARYFAAMPATNPFAFSYYTLSRSGEPGEAFTAEQATLKQSLEQLRADPHWWRIDATKDTPPIPDGLPNNWDSSIFSARDLLRTDDFALFESTSDQSRRLHSDDDWHFIERGCAKVLWAAPGVPAAILVHYDETWNDRELVVIPTDVLITYADGRAQRIYSESQWSGDELITPTWDASGRITHINLQVRGSNPRAVDYSGS